MMFEKEKETDFARLGYLSAKLILERSRGDPRALFTAEELFWESLCVYAAQSGFPRETKLVLKTMIFF